MSITLLLVIQISNNLNKIYEKVEIRDDRFDVFVVKQTYC